MDYVDSHDSCVNNVKSFVVPRKGMKKCTSNFFHVFENIHYLSCDIGEVSYNK